MTQYFVFSVCISIRNIEQFGFDASKFRVMHFIVVYFMSAHFWLVSLVLYVNCDNTRNNVCAVNINTLTERERDISMLEHIFSTYM